MAFTPSENPITHPTRESYTILRPFRFWCQKVLPLVYDDSLSYYELLCKVVDYLNKTMEDVDHMNTDVDTLYTNFQEFQEGTFEIYNELVAYVNAYFDELDVQEEIDNKLDEMVTSGELVTILRPTIADEVSDWLSEHITPTTPVIDDTLTVSGAGADAKVTGDFFMSIIDSIRKTHNIPFTFGGYIDYLDGTYHAYDGYYATDYILVSNIKYYTNLKNRASRDGIAFYNQDKTFISGYRKSNDYYEEITIPDNAFYMRASSGYDSSVLSAKSVFDIINEIYTNEIVNTNINGYVTYDTGEILAYGNTKRTDYVKIDHHSDYITNANNIYSRDGIAFYDQNKNYLSGYQVFTNNYKTINIPDNAYYMIVSSGNTFTLERLSTINTIEEEIKNIEDIAIKGERIEINTNNYCNYRTGELLEFDNYYGSGYIKIKYPKYLTNTINHASSDGIAFYDNKMIYLSGYQMKNEGIKEIIIPDNAEYMFVSGYGTGNYVEGLSVEEYVDYINNSIDDKLKYIRKSETNIPLNVNRYCNYTDGTIQDYTNYYGSGYVKIEYPYYITNAVNHASSDGIAFYDASLQYISGYQDKTDGLKVINVPNEAVYMFVSNYGANGFLIGKSIQGELDVLNESYLDIGCYGDSVTEGMSMNSHHKAEYEGDNYPSHLFTMLIDEGKIINVNNHGHGGEDTQTIIGRTTATPIFFNQDVEVTANTVIDITDKLSIRSNNENFNTTFTQIISDTSPAIIEGETFTVTISNETIRIQGTKTMTIHKNSYIFLNTKPEQLIIVYAGLNGYDTITFAKWLSMINEIKKMTNKYIVLGCTHASRSFGYWSDVVGSTEDEKHDYYYENCINNFGRNYIDLYNVFAYRALDIALEAGYFSDLSSAEIAQMRTKLLNHIIPKEFCYDKTSENNVHLSTEGYYVVAYVINERLNELNMI